MSIWQSSKHKANSTRKTSAFRNVLIYVRNIQVYFQLIIKPWLLLSSYQFSEYCHSHVTDCLWKWLRSVSICDNFNGPDWSKAQSRNKVEYLCAHAISFECDGIMERCYNYIRHCPWYKILKFPRRRKSYSSKRQSQNWISGILDSQFLWATHEERAFLFRTFKE